MGIRKYAFLMFLDSNFMCIDNVTSVPKDMYFPGCIICIFNDIKCLRKTTLPTVSVTWNAWNAAFTASESLGREKKDFSLWSSSQMGGL